jgi:hypothetical protein
MIDYNRDVKRGFARDANTEAALKDYVASQRTR